MPTKSSTLQKQPRKYFTKFPQVLKLPDLIEVQKRSYQWFFDEGLKELFAENKSNQRFYWQRFRTLFFGLLFG